MDMSVMLKVRASALRLCLLYSQPWSFAYVQYKTGARCKKVTWIVHGTLWHLWHLRFPLLGSRWGCYWTLVFWYIVNTWGLNDAVSCVFVFDTHCFNDSASPELQHAHFSSILRETDRIPPDGTIPGFGSCGILEYDLRRLFLKWKREIATIRFLYILAAIISSLRHYSIFSSCWHRDWEP